MVIHLELCIDQHVVIHLELCIGQHVVMYFLRQTYNFRGSNNSAKVDISLLKGNYGTLSGKGANSFLLGWIPFHKGLDEVKDKQQITKVVSLVKKWPKIC